MNSSINIILIFFLLISSPINADIFLRGDITSTPDINHFSMCHAQGCKEVKQLSLSKTEWQQIAQYFNPPAESADAERIQIAHAIAKFEQIVGIKTDTTHDKAGLFEHMGSYGQLDCIDESTNTTTYLHILKKQGLLKWHEPMDHVTRDFFLFGWPHSSAAMKEINTPQKNEYAVDSWFEDNDKPPHIILLSTWRSGWEPEKP